MPPRQRYAGDAPAAPGVGRAMTILLIGLAPFAAVLGLFYLKDARASHRLARLAFSEPAMRLTVVAAAVVFFGLLMAIGGLLNRRHTERQRF